MMFFKQTLHRKINHSSYQILTHQSTRLLVQLLNLFKLSSLLRPVRKPERQESQPQREYPIF